MVCVCLVGKEEKGREIVSNLKKLGFKEIKKLNGVNSERSITINDKLSIEKPFGNTKYVINCSDTVVEKLKCIYKNQVVTVALNEEQKGDIKIPNCSAGEATAIILKRIRAK